MELSLSHQQEVLALLDKYRQSPKRFIFIEMVNCLLVALGGRQAALIESSNFLCEYEQALNPSSAPDLYALITLLQLHIKVVNKKFSRILVTQEPLMKSRLTDQELGALLGFYFYDHPDFHDSKQDRLAVNISINGKKDMIYAELGIAARADRAAVVEATAQKVALWNNLLVNYDISFSYEVSLRLSTSTLLKYFYEQNWEQIAANQGGIINLFFNIIDKGVLVEQLRTNIVEVLQAHYALYSNILKLDDYIDTRALSLRWYTPRERRQLQFIIQVLNEVNPAALDLEMLLKLYQKRV